MRYLSQCPECRTIYQLDLLELNISQGMVRCACCQHSFDAYSCFITDPDYVVKTATNPILDFLSHSVDKKSAPIYKEQANKRNLYIQHVNHLMSQNVEGSRLNLYTYLNYLDTLNPIHSQSELEPHHAYKAIAKIKPRLQHQSKNCRVVYYAVWGVINLLLVGLLIAQFMFFQHS